MIFMRSSCVACVFDGNSNYIIMAAMAAIATGRFCLQHPMGDAFIPRRKPRPLYSFLGFLMGLPCSSTSPLARITLRAS